MKNFLNLNQLSMSWNEKQKPQRFRRYAAMLIMLLTLGVGQMWATVTIYAVGNMEKKGGGWVDEKTAMYCHNWGSSATTWPGQSMTKWNDVSVDGHQVWTCNLKADGNTGCIFNNNGGWQTNDITNLNATVKAYPYPTYLNGTWYYSPRVCKALWESDQHAYGGRIYFDNSSASWGDTYMYFVIGHGSYVGYYRITNIGNTKLYYVDLGSQSWGDAKYVAVVGHSSSKSSGSGNPNNLAALTHFSDAYQYSLEYQSTYLVSMSSGANCSQISMDYKSGGYSDFNSTQTINTVVKAAGGSYTSANSKATISITSYEMTGDGAVTKRTPSISTSAKQATVSAARTATTTLSVGDVATGYQFDGWYTGATSGTKLSSSTTYTYYPTAATTVYARFSEKTFTVTVTNDGNGTTSPSGAQSNKGQITGVAVSATPSDGYNFNNWTITSGTGSFADATDESTTFYPTGTATIRANFVSAATSTLTVTATTGGSITTPAAGYYSDITTTGYSIAASRSEGYKFTGWTKTAGDGAVSFSDASSLSTTATITTLGDVTVTAGFAAMSNSLSVSSSTLYAGDNITLSATRTNHSLNLTYQYKIGSGSWTDIATQSGTSKTWQIPYANTYQTYKFRVKSTDGSTSFYSAEQTVNVKGRIIIHVKNTNSWASLYLYSWYSSTTTNGAWPGKTGTGLNNQSCSIHATGSQWWDVTITQETATAQKFILNCNTSGDQNKTADLNLSSFTHDAYYAMSTNGSAVQTLSTTTTPSAPTVSTLTAGTIRETSAVLGGNIANAAALGNDIITERGYYWSTNSALSSSNLGVGTKVTISGTQSAAGNFSSTKSSLTAGTKYYFLAYAKNGYGTGYSSVQNFTTLSTYTVTVTAGAGGSASPSSVTAGQYQTSGTITASASTGYTFYNWTKTSGSGTVTFTNANASSTTLTSTNTATVRANFVDTWNLKGDQWDNWDTYKPVPYVSSNTFRTTLTLTKGQKYKFKLVKRAYNGSGAGTTDTWYGNTNAAGEKALGRGASAFTTATGGGVDDNLTVTPDVTGTYTFTINTSSTPTITVTYPTAYTITYDVGTLKGCSTAVSVSPSFTSGDYVLPETDVTFSKGSTKAGYTWKGWYSNVGGTGEAWSTTDASLSLTATRTGNISVYACYNYATYTATLSTTGRTGYGSGAPANQTATYLQAMPTITPPTATNGYCFMGYWDGEEGTGTQYYNANGTSAHAWDKTSGATLYAYFKKAEFTTLEHNATVAKGDVITLDVNPVLNVTPVDYTAICWTLHYSENDNEVPSSGDHYYSVASYTEGGSKPRQVRFTMTNLAVGSYYVKAVLKAKASAFSSVCSEGTTLDTETGDFRIVGSSKITINYQYYYGGDVIAPSGMVEIEAESTAGIKAPNIIGYTFDSWSLGVGVTNTCADGTSCGLDKDSINISSPYDGVITAFYNKKQMIYFNNTLGWDDVYVYFYDTSKEYWANDYGTGANKKQYFNGQYPFGNGYYGHMTHIEGTDVWYFDYQAASIPTLTKVAFANKEQVYDKSPATNDEAYFHDASVVYRTDFDASHLSMFVPIDAVKHDYTANTGSKYYHGYWINYPENTGYKLMIFDRKGDGALFVKDQDFTHNANKRMPMSISLELEGGKTYGFKVYRNDVKWYGNGGTMTNGSSGDEGQTVWEFTTGTTNCGLTTTSSGIYTFTLSYGQDNYSNYNFLMGVRYPESEGDFRLQYKDNVNSTWKTSTVIPAVTESDTISYFVRKASTPYIRVQKCTSVDGSGNPTWTNQSSGANIISSLPSEITADGVYNFIFSKNNGALQLDTVASYTGNFYIRVGADGDLPWDNYRVSSQIMPFSEYSFNQTTNPYSHYFTKYYRTMNDNGTAADPSSINVTFVVANDYSTNISDTITTDDTGTSYVNASGILSGNNANIRFMYNYKTNVATRRYLDDAQGPRATDFLLLIPSDNTSIYDAETGGSGKTQVQLSDKGNWVYEANVWVVPGTEYQVKATFGRGTSIVQYLKGAASGAHQYELLVGGEGSSRLQIRLLYDFKTNRIIAAYLPSGTIDENLEIDADIMFVREHQGNVTQITFGENKSISEIHNVYSVLRFNKSTINDYALSRYERDLFYISFPYNVLVSDIIGFGTYGTHWIIEYYDGADRAAKGFWKDSKSFWKFVTPAMASSYTLQAGTGYIVALDLDEMGYSSTIWDNTSTVELIFPGDISSISNQEVTYNMPIHQCNIGPRWEGASDRRIKDSHWNILGVPTYHNTTGSFANHTDEIGEKEQVWSADNAPKYLYIWNMTDNSLTVTDATGYNYKAMHAYVVQYYGDVTFHTSTNAVPAIVARRTYADAPSEVSFRMEIQQNDQMVDHTFVKLSNDETISSEFVFGEDMSKEFNTNKANIYTMVTSILNDTATVTEVAGNILPMSDQTTVVPVGVTLTADGDYTFAIPDGTSGVGVTLVDTETGIRTSLSALSYTVNLTAGTHDGRFLLEIAPIQQTPTDIEEVTGDGLQVTGARKVIIDQQMYIIRDGKMYDARGAMIK